MTSADPARAEGEKLELVDSTLLVEAADAFAQSVAAHLHGLIPPGAEIRHIGATSIPGCLTKGDVDIVVRVSRQDFKAARDALDREYRPNLGSVRDDSFASFYDESGIFPLGIQLVVQETALDQFHLFSKQLLRSPAVRNAYNALKKRFAGQDMESYRNAKSAFIDEVLSGRFHEAAQTEPIGEPLVKSSMGDCR